MKLAMKRADPYNLHARWSQIESQMAEDPYTLVAVMTKPEQDPLAYVISPGLLKKLLEDEARLAQTMEDPEVSKLGRRNRVLEVALQNYKALLADARRQLGRGAQISNEGWQSLQDSLAAGNDSNANPASLEVMTPNAIEI